MRDELAAKIKEYVSNRIKWEIEMGEEEQHDGRNNRLKLNDKVARWKYRLIRIEQQINFFIDNLKAVDLPINR